MQADAALREHLQKLLETEQAHSGFEAAVAGLPARLRAAVPEGLPYSAWQLVEHLRITQRDILDFCVDPAYKEPHWPDDYWPKSAGPPLEAAWDSSVAAFLEDRAALVRLALDPQVDLLAKVPVGNGQTFLREVLLVADHNAYHIGQLVLLRRLLGNWPAR